MHVAREAELGGVAAEQASALGRVRDEYEAQLSRLHKLSEETWAALRAHADQRTEEQAMEHAAEVERLEREKEAIKEQLRASEKVIPIEEQSIFQITGNRLFKDFQQLRKEVGIIGLRWHDLRHEATSRLFEKGLNIMEVASITGHEDLKMLKRYTHIKPESLVARLG